MRTGIWKRQARLAAAGIVAAALIVALQQHTVRTAAAEPGLRLVSPIQTRSLPASQREAELDGSSIDRAAQEGMKRYGIPGLALGIVKDGRTVYLNGYGIADDSGRRVTPETPFILGSVSKSFTALAVMQLAEKGMLDLDKEAKAYLPEVRLAVPEGGWAITVRDLLRHTSGLSMYVGRSMLSAKGLTPIETTKRVGLLEAEERPGASFQYSNANYILLGAIVEQVSGLPYPKYMDEHVFKPLDMMNSFADPAAAETKGMAVGFQRIFGKMTGTHWPIRPSNVPAGYLAASAEDMTHYLIAQMGSGRYGDAVLLSKEGMEMMHRSSSGFPYGMGWFISPSAISHGGDAENFHADIIMLPGNGWAIAVLMNTNDAFMTGLYGNVYETLSYQLLQAASGGAAFPGGLPETARFGPAVYLMNALVVLLSLWALWAVWRLWYLWRKQSRYGWNAVYGVKRAWVSMLHIGLPLGFVFGFPRMMQAPWATVMSFMPGWGHALFIVPLVLLITGIAEGAMGAWNRWGWQK